MILSNFVSLSTAFHVYGHSLFLLVFQEKDFHLGHTGFSDHIYFLFICAAVTAFACLALLVRNLLCQHIWPDRRMRKQSLRANVMWIVVISQCLCDPCQSQSEVGRKKSKCQRMASDVCFHSIMRNAVGNHSVGMNLQTKFVSVDDFGAHGNGQHDDSKAFQTAWAEACSSSEPSTLLVPHEKTYLLKPLEFVGPCASSLTIQVSGTILAPENPGVWKNFNRREWIRFKRIENLIVEGGGTVIGSGGQWWSQSCKVVKSKKCLPAPTALIFDRMHNLTIRNLVIKEAQQTHIKFRNCLNVEADQLNIHAPEYSPNTDGIHVSASKDIIISNSLIRTGDDCISIGSQSFNILIEKITCGPGHGISIGSLGKKHSEACVANVMVNDALLANCKNGLRIKTWQGGYGFATRIVFQNVLMHNVKHPIVIDQFYCDSRQPCKNETSAVKISDVNYVGIKGTSATKEVMRFACSQKYPCKNIILADIDLTVSSRIAPVAFCENAEGYTNGNVSPEPCLQSDTDFRSENSIAEIVPFQLPDYA